MRGVIVRFGFMYASAVSMMNVPSAIFSKSVLSSAMVFIVCFKWYLFVFFY